MNLDVYKIDNSQNRIKVQYISILMRSKFEHDAIVEINTSKYYDWNSKDTLEIYDAQQLIFRGYIYQCKKCSISKHYKTSYQYHYTAMAHNKIDDDRNHVFDISETAYTLGGDMRNIYKTYGEYNKDKIFDICYIECNDIEPHVSFTMQYSSNMWHTETLPIKIDINAQDSIQKFTMRNVWMNHNVCIVSSKFNEDKAYIHIDDANPNTISLMKTIVGEVKVLYLQEYKINEKWSVKSKYIDHETSQDQRINIPIILEKIVKYWRPQFQYKAGDYVLHIIDSNNIIDRDSVKASAYLLKKCIQDHVSLDEIAECHWEEIDNIFDDTSLFMQKGIYQHIFEMICKSLKIYMMYKYPARKVTVKLPVDYHIDLLDTFIIKNDKFRYLVLEKQIHIEKDKSYMTLYGHCIQETMYDQLQLEIDATTHECRYTYTGDNKCDISSIYDNIQLVIPDQCNIERCCAIQIGDQ